jgi:ABC-type nickel/cobalt efflux system permease component RcnA
LAKGLRLELDGVRQPLRLNDVRSQTNAGAGGLSTFRVEIDLFTDRPDRPALLHFVDENFTERIGWKEIVIPGAGFESDRSNGLRNYPSDLLSTPPDVMEATVRIPAGDLARNSLSPAVDASSTQNKDLLTIVLTADELPPRMILLGMAIAFALGAMHALSPGHGKTLVAAYLVGNRGTARHALFLGAVVTLTHTAGVFLLGIVTLFFSGYVVPERLYPWLGFVSGLTILAIGIKLFQQRLGSFASHHHHGPDGHTHEIPTDLSRRSLFAMGLSGGIVPCPSALVVLLSAVALHRIQAGLLFILAFSVGLASVLVAIGILVVRAGQWLSRFNSHQSALQLLPIASAGIVTVIGCAISIQSLATTGLIGGGLSLNGGLMAVLGLGLLLGLKHATDADHIVAVTTFVTQERSLLRSCWIGAFWGVGHTLSLAVAGVIVIFLRINISEWLAARLELLVAVMLIVLGGRALLQAFRGKYQMHSHQHSGLKPLLVGLVHGAAGSAALMLLVLSTIRSPFEAFIYILVFGLGSILGMLAISFLLALPLQWAKGRVVTSHKPIQLMAGVFSCVFGLYLGAHIWLALP